MSAMSVYLNATHKAIIATPTSLANKHSCTSQVIQARQLVGSLLLMAAGV
jgi:hypothetical protein